MKVLRSLSTLLVCAALAACGCISHAQEPEPLPLAAVISQIKREIAAAQRVPGASNLLLLDQVDVTLNVTRAVDANGKLSVGIPAAGAEIGASGARKSDQASTVQVVLVPPRAAGLLNADEIKDFGLTQMIIETRRQLAAGLTEEPRLDPQKVVLTVKFSITRTGGPSASLKLVVVSIGAGATVTSADTHTVVLTFSRPKAP